MSQFALPLAWPADARDAEFVVSQSNAGAIRILERWATWPVHTAILAGPPRSGRSILARLFAARAGAEVIDDADRAPEDQVFHAWNRAQGERRPLLLVAAAAPPAWQLALPDLRSRLGASPVARIDPPDDALIAQLLVRGFERNRIDARPDLVVWLAARVERSHAAIEQIVARLAHEAIATRRRLSIPLARATLDGEASTSRSSSE